MTAHAQVARSTVTNFTPSALSRATGELFVNLADRRMMVIDTSRAAQDLLGVRKHAATASYVAGDLVSQGTQLYRAKSTLSPHAFNAAEWDQYLAMADSDARYTSQAQNDARYVRLAGSTMTGALTLAGAPTSALHAATKAYTDGLVSNYLPLAGGTVTGALNVAGQFWAQGADTFISGTLHINPNNAWEWQFLRDGSGNHIQSHTSGWYEYWQGTTGNWNWVSPGAVLMTLTGVGDFYAHASLNAPNVNASNQITAVNNITSSNGSIVSLVGTVQGAYVHSTGNIQADSTFTGGGVNVGGAGVTTSGGGSFAGNVGVGGQVSAASLWSLSRLTLSNDSNFWIGDGAAGRIINWASGHYYEWNASNGNQSIVLNGTVYWQVRGDAIAYNPNGPVAGTTFISISDARFKEVLPDEVEGLEALLQLAPVKYQLTEPSMRQGDDPPYTHIGFLAQDVQPVVPDAVVELTRMGEPTLFLDNGAILAVVVNSIKELEARVVALERSIAVRAP